jgi:hypothetical protein
MGDLIETKQAQRGIAVVRGVPVILPSRVAEIHGVPTCAQSKRSIGTTSAFLKTLQAIKNPALAVSQPFSPPALLAPPQDQTP